MSCSDSDDENSSNEDCAPEDDEEIAARPSAIRSESDFSDFVINPIKDGQLAAADMDGYLNLFRFGVDELSEQTLRKRLSRKPLRCISYTKDGEGIFVAGKKGSLRLFNLEMEKCSHVLMNNESPSYCTCVINLNLVASGDDDGTLKVWDIRKGKTPIIEEDRSHDFISCLATDANGKYLFATSGDGTMSTFNVKRRKFLVQSENAEYDMSCVTVIKNNKKVTVGTSEGLMLFYNWEEFAAPSDRFPGHSSPIECIVPINEDIVCTGSLDGMIRAVHTLPNRFLGVVGEHRGISVSKIDVTNDRRFIASSSHDSIIRFWSVEHLHGTNVDANAKPVKSLRTKKLVKSGVSGDKISFLSDLDKDMTVPNVESSSDSDDADNE